MKSPMFLFLTPFLFLFACGGETTEDMWAEHCEHLEEGPGVAVEAVAGGTGPDVFAAHQRWDVTLAATGAGRGGAVNLVSDAAGDVSFVLDKDVGAALTDNSGAEVAFETATPAPCGDGGMGYVAEVEVGFYTLTFGPTDETLVGMVIEEGGHDHEE